MNLGIIVTPNQKGQIVIPQKLRESLGIAPNQPLQLIQTGDSIMVRPITGIITPSDTESSYLEVLKTTAGSWEGESSKTSEEVKHQRELKASEKRRKSW